MIIYYDGNQNGLTGNMTPYQVYVAINDFAKILDEINDGNLPTGSGQVFPVNFKTKTDTDDVPWYNQQGTYTQSGFGL